MAVPTVPISTEYLNGPTDDPNLARVDLEKMAIAVNQIMVSYNVANGFAMLDASGKLSTAIMPSKNQLLTGPLAGANAGLDADTLDGLDSTTFVRVDGTQTWQLPGSHQQILYAATTNNTHGRIFHMAAIGGGTTAAGYGLDFGYVLQQNGGAPIEAANLGVEWIDANAATATAAFTFATRGFGTLETALKYYSRRFEMLERPASPPGAPNTNKWWLYFMPAGLFIKDDTGVEVQIGGGTTLDHGSLLGRADDDHDQYLLVSGARAMTGNLLLGNNLLRFTDRTPPAVPASGQVYLYSKNQQLYYMPFNGVEVGPLGAGAGGGGSTTHAALTDLAAQNDDHAQYVLRQPTVAKPTVINESGGNFDFRVEGVGTPDLIHVFANTSTVVLNSNAALGYGRLEIAAGAGRIGVFVAATDNTAVYATSNTGVPTIQSVSGGTAQAMYVVRTSNSGTPTAPVMQISELGSGGFRALDVTGKASTDTMRVRVGTVDAFRVTATSIIFNDSQHTYDLLIKSVTNATLFSVDSAADVVKVGTSTVNAYAALNVNGGSKYGIYAISGTTGKSAIYSDAIGFSNTIAGTFAGGNSGNRGQGLRVTSVTDETATFTKTLSGAGAAAYAVQMTVATGTDAAHVLHLAQSGSGDILRCEGPFATTNHYPFRVLPNGSTVWEYLAGHPANPPTGSYAIYCLSNGVYVRNSSGGFIGPLGTGTGSGGVTDHGLLDPPSLLDDDHTQYVLRQPVAPATETVINDAGGNFNFRIEGLATPNLFNLNATSNCVGINVVPGTTGRLEVDGAGRYGIYVVSTTLPSILATSTTGNTIWASGQNICFRATRSVSSAPAGPIMSLEDLGTAGNRVLDVNAVASTAAMRVKVGTIDALYVKATQCIINDTQSTYDFVVKSASMAQVFATSASSNGVFVGATVVPPAGSAILNVNAGSTHGVYALAVGSAVYAGYFDSRAATGWAVYASGGINNTATGRGQGLLVESVRDITASFTKGIGAFASLAGYCVSIAVNNIADAAIPLGIYNTGTGDYIQCINNVGTNQFRLANSGAIIWADIATDPDPPATFHSLYFKGGGLYVKAPGVAAVGPLGTGGTGTSDHNALTNLTTGLTHTQYVPYQQVAPATTTIINNAAGDFDFNIRGLANNNLFHIDAGNGTVAINRTAGSTSLGRFQVLDSGINPAIWASSVGSIGVSTGTVSGTALSATSSGGGGAAYIYRSSSVGVGTVPVCDIIENDPTNAYLVLRVTTSTATTQPMALFRQGSNDRLSINATEMVINDSAQPYNFRVEGVSNPDLFRVQPGNDSVGINMVPSTSGRLEITAGTGRYGILCAASTQSAIYCGATTGTTIVTEGNVQVFKGLRTATSTPTVAAVQIDDIGGFGFRLLDLNAKAATDVMRARVGSNEVFSIRAASAIINDLSSNYDFVVKGMTAGQLFTVTANGDVVNVNGALTQARFNVQGGAKHGIYSLAAATGSYAGYFEQQGIEWCLRVQGGNVGGRGAGLWASSVRDSTAIFAKVLGAAAVTGTFAVRASVDTTSDTAIVLSLVNSGTGDYFRCEDAATIAHFRVPAGGGSVWHDQTTTMPNPGTDYHSLYFKNNGLYINGPSGEFGPLATATSAVGASHSLLSAGSLAADDHIQYFLVNGGRAMTGRLVMDANYIELDNLAIPVAPAVGTIKLYSSGDMLAVRTNTGSIVLGNHNTQINLTTGDPHTQYALRQPTSTSTFFNSALGNYDFAIHGVIANALYFSAGQHNFGINQIPSPGAGRIQIASDAAPALLGTGLEQVVSFSRAASTTPTQALMALTENGSFGFRMLDINGRAATDVVRIKVGVLEAFKVLAAETVINDSGLDYNFRAEGVSTPNLLYVNANSGSVGINTTAGSGQGRLEVSANAAGRYGIIAGATDTPALWANTTTGTTALLQGNAQLFRATRNVSATPTVSIMQLEDIGSAGFRVLDINGKAGVDLLRARVGAIDAFRLNAGGAVFNDNLTGYVFTIRGTVFSTLFNVDTVNDAVQVGISTDVGGALNVNGGSAHGIYVTTSTAGKSAIYANADTVATYAVNIVAGFTGGGGRGQGLAISSYRDEALTITKTSAAFGALAAYAARVNVASAADTAIALYVYSACPSEIFRCEGPAAMYPLRVAPGNTLAQAIMFSQRVAATTPTKALMQLEDIGAAGFRILDLNAKPTTDAMQVMVGVVNAFSIRAAETVVNEGAQNYNFRVEGVATPNLLTVIANTDTISVNSATPSGLARLEVLAGGRIGIGVTADTSHGILIVQNTTAQRGLYSQAGTDANGRGVAISAESCRDATLVVSKNLLSQSVASAYSVGIFVLQAADTAHGILLTNYGTGDHIRVTDSTTTHFRLLAGGGSNWSDLAADMATPGGSTHAMYFKSDGLYVKNSVGTVFGPMLGTDGQTTVLSTGVGSIKMAGTTARPNDGWINTNLKNGTAIRIPYWTTITG